MCHGMPCILFLFFLAIDCGDPGIPTNGQRNLSSTTYNSAVTYTCDVGYTLQGSNSRKCLYTGRWRGSVPQCIGKLVKSLLHVQKVRKFQFCRKSVNVTEAKPVKVHADVEVTFIFFFLPSTLGLHVRVRVVRVRIRYVFSSQVVHLYYSFVMHFNQMPLVQYFHIGELNSSFSFLI